MQREHRAQVTDCAVFLERALALGREELHVRLRDAELDLAGFQKIDVGHRTAGRLDRAAHPVLGAIAIDDAADRTAGRVINTGHAAGADRDKALLLRAGGAWQRRSGDKSSRKCAAHIEILNFIVDLLESPQWNGHVTRRGSTAQDQAARR